MQVMFPLFSQLQNDLKQMKNTLDMSIQIISFVTFPLIAILILVAHPMICFCMGINGRGLFLISRFCVWEDCLLACKM